ncbi:MAG: biotin/lipoyl-binding protein [Gemmatales bacterium]
MATTHYGHPQLFTENTLKAARLAATPRTTRLWSRYVLLGICILPVVLLFVPWTQTVHGTGSAIAFNQVERAQFLVSPIEGRVKKWYVVEGQQVRAGQRIVEMVDNDPNLERRLLEEEQAILDRLRAAENRVQEIDSRIRNIASSRDLQLSVGEGFVRIELNQLENAQLQEIEAKTVSDVAVINYQRVKRLFENNDGSLESKRNLELAERDMRVAEQRLRQAGRIIEIRKQSLQNAKDNLDRVRKDMEAMINSENAIKQSAMGEVATIRRDQAQIAVRIARQRAQYVDAPCDGTIWQIMANAENGGILVRPGERLALLVPEIKRDTKGRKIVMEKAFHEHTAMALWLNPALGMNQFSDVLGLASQLIVKQQRFPLTTADLPGIVAVLQIDGNDLPLVREGDLVRLQFEGWPAVQFVGWPSVAVGTFGGKVFRIDPNADAKGKFRIFVEPNPEEQPWPNEDYLRQGVRAQGWVLLNRVSAGYELWRQINGFPPFREMPEKSGTSYFGPAQRK